MKRARPLLTLLLTLLCLGQSVLVVSAPCSMLDQDSVPAAADAGDMLHAGHHMDSAATADADAGDCCQAGGYCSIGGCVSLLALTPAVFATPPIASPYPYLLPLPTSPSHRPDALFRPPIIS
jgi:hypothetical protein